MSTQSQALGSAQPIRHPWREVVYRARDPRFVADSALRVMMPGWDLVSPSQFSQIYRQVRGSTMCSNARLRGLYRALHYVVSRNIPSDIVECGQRYDPDHKSVCRQSCPKEEDFEKLVHCCNGIISILPSAQVRESTGDEFFSGERVRPPG